MRKEEPKMNAQQHREFNESQEELACFAVLVLFALVAAVMNFRSFL